jgi:hypothetical protein
MASNYSAGFSFSSFGGGYAMSLRYSVVIAEPVRTAVGTFGGSLKDIPAVELGDRTHLRNPAGIAWVHRRYLHFFTLPKFVKQKPA